MENNVPPPLHLMERGIEGGEVQKECGARMM